MASSSSRHLALLSLFCVSCSAAPARPTTTTLPSSTVFDAAGKSSTLTEVLRGRVAVVDLWATWCDACERERPKLERLARAYRPRGLVVVALNVGEPSDVVAEYRSRHPFGYPVYSDPEFRFADALSEDRLPTILLITPDGQIAHRSSRLDDLTLRRITEVLSQSSGPAR